MKRRAWFFAALAVFLAATRLCHSGILWAEETLPLAAAAQGRLGLTIYRDYWFDKPPLLVAFHGLPGIRNGVPLRLAGAALVLAACALAFAMARERWGEREGYLSAAALAFFLTFDTPSAVIPAAADTLLIAPHMAALYLTWKRLPVAAGAAAGVAFLCNSKGVFALLSCLAWNFRALPALALGFGIPNLAAGAWLWSRDALLPFYEQVFQWGRVYAGGTFVANPLTHAATRTANWLGFHAALVLAAARFWVDGREAGRGRWAAWAALSFAAVCLGWRFFPRYFLQVLPVAALLAARGFCLASKRLRAVILLAALVPLVRFGPRFALLTRGDAAWSDTAMDRDSRDVACLVGAAAPPGATLLVWGFRAEIYVYTGLRAATRFLDSQPLTGVPADRHLNQSTPLAPELARRNRRELAESRPGVIVDGLGGYNKDLAITAFPDLVPWMAGYREAGRTGHSVVWIRQP